MVTYTLKKDNGSDPIISWVAVTKEETDQLDTKSLEVMIETAEEIKANGQGDYSDDDWQQFVSSLTSANEILANSEATQEELNSAEMALQKAIEALEIPVDKAELQELVDTGESLEEAGQGNYTEDSWNAFLSAFSSAKEILENEETTQTEIDEALDSLQAALDGLEELTIDGS